MRVSERQRPDVYSLSALLGRGAIHFVRSQKMLDGRLGMDVPEHLREVAIRHERHITDLVSQLKSYGMDAQAIERSVNTLIESYRAELLEAIKALGGMDSV